jgi:hypothetical protein
VIVRHPIVPLALLEEMELLVNVMMEPLIMQQIILYVKVKLII